MCVCDQMLKLHICIKIWSPYRKLPALQCRARELPSIIGFSTFINIHVSLTWKGTTSLFLSRPRENTRDRLPLPLLQSTQKTSVATKQKNNNFFCHIFCQNNKVKIDSWAHDKIKSNKKSQGASALLYTYIPRIGLMPN